MSFIDNRKKIPEYYDTMYLDGYSPAEIMEAVHQKVMKDYMEREKARQQEEETKKIDKAVQKELDKTVKKALDDIFKGFK